MSRTPRVGLDYWPATTHAPGVGRYARELVRALARLDDPPRLSLLDVGPGPRPMDGAPLGLSPLPDGWRRIEADLPRGALAPLSALGLGAERLLGGCDLFHRVLPGEPPLGRVRQVLALAQLPPPRGDAERALRTALCEVDDVVVFSAHARELVVERFAVPLARVHALPVGCEHWTRDAPPRDELPGPPLVLALGRTDRARGPLALLDAVELNGARGLELELVLCGRPGDAAVELREALARSPARASARWIEEPLESELPELVARSAVLVHLSAEELTPVTPLEALASGAAVVASRLPAFVEALGVEGLWIGGPPSALDPDALAMLLERALASGLDPAARRRRRAHAAPYTWARHASLTAELWGRILAR